MSNQIQMRLMADEDRMSQLPGPILENLFLLLSWEDAAHMTAVSKSWRHMWALFPKFSFNFDQNLSAFTLCSELRLKLEKETEDFINSVDQALVDVRPGKAIIEKLRLCMFVTDPKIASCIDGWIEIATKNFIGELDIEIRDGWETLRYSLPYTTLVAKPLQALRLSGCKLEKPLFDGNEKYFYLRKVFMSNVYVEDEAFLDFMNRFSALEDFTMWNCKGLKSLLIPPLLKLERLTVSPAVNYVKAFKRVDIEAVNLQYFHYGAFSGSKVNQILDIGVVNCTYLRELTIKGVNLRDGLLEGLLSKLPLLQNLTLTRFSNVSSVKISHPLLHNLILYVHNGFVQLEIETPNLLVFKYDVVFLPDVFTINAPRLQESHLRIVPKDYIDTPSFLSLRRYLSNFDQLDVLAFDFGKHAIAHFMNRFWLDQLNGFEIPPVPVVKHLRLERVGIVLNYEALLNGLLWSCHPEILIVESFFKCNANFIRFLFKKLLNRDEDPMCCDSSGMRCWRHHIKDVVIERLMVIEDRNAFLSSLPTKDRGSKVRFELKW